MAFKALCFFKNLDAAFECFTLNSSENAKRRMANCRLSKNRTPLHLFKNPDHIAEFLKYAPVDTLGDTLKSTPLMLAVRRRDLSLVELFIEHGADVNIPDKYGNGVVSRIIKMEWVEGFKVVISRNPILSSHDYQNISEQSGCEMMKIVVHHLITTQSLTESIVGTLLWKAVSLDEVDLVESMILPFNGDCILRYNHRPIIIQSPRMATLFVFRGMLTRVIAASSLGHALPNGCVDTIKIFIAAGIQMHYIPYEIINTPSGCEIFELLLAVFRLQCHHSKTLHDFIYDFIGHITCQPYHAPYYLGHRISFLEMIDKMKTIAVATQCTPSYPIPSLFDMVWYAQRAMEIRSEIKTMERAFRKF